MYSVIAVRPSVRVCTSVCVCPSVCVSPSVCPFVLFTYFIVFIWGPSLSVLQISSLFPSPPPLSVIVPLCCRLHWHHYRPLLSPTTSLCLTEPLFVAGFIDFIVDPSFQVMGDMLEKIIEPMQRRNACTISEEGDDPNAVVDKATSTTSITSSSSSSSTPKSPSPGSLSPSLSLFMHDAVPQHCLKAGAKSSTWRLVQINDNVMGRVRFL